MSIKLESYKHQEATAHIQAEHGKQTNTKKGSLILKDEQYKSCNLYWLFVQVSTYTEDIYL